MKIRFLLPVLIRTPVGGFKIVFEYANRLQARGHDVCVDYAVHFELSKSVAELARRKLRCMKLNAGFGGGIPRMNLGAQARIRMIPDLRWKWIRDAADVVVATAWETAEYVQHYPDEAGRKLYFIQDYEYFMSGTPEIQSRMAATYRSGMTKMAIAPVIAELVRKAGGEDVQVIENGMNLERYRLNAPIESEQREWVVGFPARAEPFKRTQDAIAVLEHIRPQTPKLRGWSFGGARPPCMPGWVEYHERPSDEQLVALYNQTAVFLTPSEYEGWGLPGSEAMACGAALVSADHGGVRAYACHGETALLAPPRDIDALAAHVLDLLNDPSRRIAMATRGYQSMQRFTWTRAVDKFENVLKQATACAAPAGRHAEAVGVA